MSSRLITNPEAESFEPMPWMQMASPAQSGPIFREVKKPDKTVQAELQAAVAAAEAKAEARVREARETGRREGDAAARQALQAETREMLGRLAASLQELAGLRPKLRAQAESDLVRLAISIARRIVQRELSLDPETITALARVAMDKLRMQEVTRVRVNTEHKTILQEFLAKSGASHVEVIGDAAQLRGAVIFETTRGNVDASAETQLKEIERGLTDRLRGQNA